MYGTFFFSFFFPNTVQMFDRSRSYQRLCKYLHFHISKYCALVSNSDPEMHVTVPLVSPTRNFFPCNKVRDGCFKIKGWMKVQGFYKTGSNQNKKKKKKGITPVEGAAANKPGQKHLGPFSKGGNPHESTLKKTGRGKRNRLVLWFGLGLLVAIHEGDDVDRDVISRA